MSSSLAVTPLGVTRIRVIVFTIASGIAAANLHWAQPLIAVMASSVDVSPSTAAWLVTVTQIGYALGIFLVVPLGDVLSRRRLVPVVLSISALMLLAAALAPTFSLLVAALGAVGLTTISAQLLAPLASELAAPEQRGRIVGTIASGVLTGVLLSRTVSGLVADAFGWRAIYIIGAILTVILALVLAALIPRLESREHVSYPRLLASVLTTVFQYRAALPTILICALGFTVFSLFWTSLTFLLTAPPFAYSVGQIGLVGLAGLAGALAARKVGAFHDRGWSIPATGVVLVLLCVSLIGAWAAASSIVALLVFVILFDVAAQANSVLGQTRLLSLSGQEGSRLNTALVASNFTGGAMGSAISGVLWGAGGWPAVMVAALIFTLAALSIWVATRKRLRIRGSA